MAGVAGYFLLIFELCVVDFLYHAHHLPRSLLWSLVVLLKCVLYMAIIAMNSQRRGDELHGWQQQVGRCVVEHFQVLENLSALFVRAGRWPLRGTGNGKHKSEA